MLFLLLKKLWIFSNKARAITKNKDPSLVNCNINIPMSQIKGRESITHSLKMELQQNEWRNINNIAKCKSWSKHGKVTFIRKRFNKTLDQRTRLLACIMKEQKNRGQNMED